MPIKVSSRRCYSAFVKLCCCVYLNRILKVLCYVPARFWCIDIISFWHVPAGVHRPNIDIGLQSGWFWATSIASFGERLLDFRSWWIVSIHVVWGRLTVHVQFSNGEAVKIFLASVSSGIRTLWLNAMLGQQLKGAFAWFSVSPRHSPHNGTIWFLAAFADAIDCEHKFRVHLSWGLPSTQPVQEYG